MSRKIISISLPDEVHTFVERRVAALGHGTTSEYFRGLIRMDKRIEEMALRQEPPVNREPRPSFASRRRY